MERDRLTFLVITDASQPARPWHVSRRTLRYIVGGLASVLLFMVVGSGALLLKLGELAKAERLERENTELVASLAEMDQTIDQLSQSLATMTERDRRYRLLAGLGDIDPEVRQVGIGGPGSGSLETEPLFAVNALVGEKVFDASSDLNRLLRQANLLSVSLEEATRAMETKRDQLTSYPSIDPVNGLAQLSLQPQPLASAPARSPSARRDRHLGLTRHAGDGDGRRCGHLRGLAARIRIHGGDRSRQRDEHALRSQSEELEGSRGR